MRPSTISHDGSEPEGPPTDELPSVTPPAAPQGTKYDGHPLFEALVFGWACAADGWNGQTERLTSPLPVRIELEGYFEQFVEQRKDELEHVGPDPSTGAGRLGVEWDGGDHLYYVSALGTPLVLSTEPTGSEADDLVELTDARERLVLGALLRWALQRIGA